VKSNINNQNSLQYIPTVIKGRVIPKVQNARNDCISSNNIKPHKLIILGDSLLRGVAENGRLI
jgi:hypothetical protein